MIYTVTNSYFATGEGITYMLMFTRGYGRADDGRDNAMESFEKQFGAYFSRGAEITEGLNFDFPGAKLLISDELKAKLELWNQTAGGLEYHASIHVNFS